MTDETRITRLNDLPSRRGDYVLYWMQQSQRARCNAALEKAAELAYEARQPLLACFGLMADYPEANVRHYTFLLEGLQETARALEERGVALAVLRDHPVRAALKLASRASALVCDAGYLRHQRSWRREVAEGAACPVVQVESDVIIPVAVASDHREFAARTIRRKIQSRVEEFLDPSCGLGPVESSLGLGISGISIDDIPKVCSEFGIDDSVPPVSRFFRGGTSQAERRFADFLADRFERYEANRNQPQTDDVSHMSPYLHFGQVSTAWIAGQVRKRREFRPQNRDSYLEELIVRRELAVNFVHYTPDYDSYSSLPAWARQTLEEHRKDPRRTKYTAEELEGAGTHDPYWNAAMREMKITGYMHNAMRMYWGKKILEWTEAPEEAYRIVLELNNKYFLDGRDPSSYANVGWIFGLHDRPFAERPVFGKVRFMNARGLERKSDIAAYVAKVERLVEERSDP
jgi:deoxyribodipyrimidine photo-lyase